MIIRISSITIALILVTSALIYNFYPQINSLLKDDKTPQILTGRIYPIDFVGPLRPCDKYQEANDGNISK
jgi:hypothetical protein